MQAAYGKFESKGTFRRFCFAFFVWCLRFCVQVPQLYGTKRTCLCCLFGVFFVFVFCVFRHPRPRV